MESLTEIWERLAKDGHKSDKGDIHSYLPVYEELLSKYRESPSPLLEIGLFNGDSLRMWEQYFDEGREVYGIDCSETPHDGLADLRPMIKENIHNIYILDATNKEEVKMTFHEFCEFDVIIDDAGHDINQQIELYKIWKSYLNEGGVYIIEDVQDIERTKVIFESMGGEIIDLRHIKGRYDDVLVIIKK